MIAQMGHKEKAPTNIGAYFPLRLNLDGVWRSKSVAGGPNIIWDCNRIDVASSSTENQSINFSDQTIIAPIDLIERRIAASSDGRELLGESSATTSQVD